MSLAEQEIADHVRVRHLGTVCPATGGLWPSLEVVEHGPSGRMALVVMSDTGTRQLGAGTTHAEARAFAAQVLSLRGQGVPEALHKLALAYVALAYVALACQAERASGGAS